MDPYSVLGVPHGATPEQIKSAYRKLAAKHHPDRGGDTAAFQEVQAAYDHLTGQRVNQDAGHPGDPFSAFAGFGPGHPFGDIFNQFMRSSRQRIYTVTVYVTLEQIVQGRVENVQINTPTGPKLIQLQIPNTIDDGHQVRYDGIMEDGPLQVLFMVHRHPRFTRQGQDLLLTQKINVFELITGTELKVTDIHGMQTIINIPAGTKPGTKLRMQGRGVGPSGDQYVLLEAVLPDKISPDTLQQIRVEVERGKQ